MKITNLEIFNLINAINDIKDYHLPVKTGFALIKNLKLLQPCYESLLECRDEILRGAGASSQPDGQLIIPQDQGPHVQQSIQELCQIENDIDLTYISIDDLNGFDISMDILNCLYPIISEGN